MSQGGEKASAGGTRGLRADAERNRARVLSAARQVFLESGTAAPLDEIARRAGVHIATLYRRFPDRGGADPPGRPRRIPARPGDRASGLPRRAVEPPTGLRQAGRDGLVSARVPTVIAAAVERAAQQCCRGPGVHAFGVVLADAGSFFRATSGERNPRAPGTGRRSQVCPSSWCVTRLPELMRLVSWNQVITRRFGRPQPISSGVK
ncbi:TetR/AcrR family transcriptional regulator [Streptomyces noursei]|uniref:TetR/AcrR family transcriptional regulator n=1 Tax=Streptomyces noursei TaxID=1971 RepID=UPI0019642301|nr:helix-turn-helix transcriptional regulator [Streptomyces noursei]